MSFEQKLSVLITIPENRLKTQLFDSANISEINRRYNVEWNPYDRELSRNEVMSMLPGKDAIITAWGSPSLAGEILDHADRLRFVGHTGGTVKWLVDENFFVRDMVVVTANSALAPAISEYCLMISLMASWDTLNTIGTVRAGKWLLNEDVCDGLNNKSIGIVGYGLIARDFVRLLRSFDVSIRVFSNHCDKREAEEMGFALVSLNEALDCDIVSLHSTLNDQTHHMLGTKELARIRDGALLINTARALLIEENAFMAELQKQRFSAVLDVFYDEPLPANHFLRFLDNVICTPHIAGANRYWRRKQSDIVFADLERFFAGEKPLYSVSLEQYRRLTPI